LAFKPQLSLKKISVIFWGNWSCGVAMIGLTPVLC